MAIRLRKTPVGLVALCAARSVAKAGDIYLDDVQHYALTEKFWLDYPECGITPSSEISSVIEQEESNNPNRTWWDTQYG